MATKQISRQISMNSDKKNCLHIYHVEKCLHVTDFTPHFSTWHDFSLYLPCRDISPTEYLSCGETSPHDNLSYGKFSPHDKFFLHKHRLWCLWQISGMVHTDLYMGLHCTLQSLDIWYCVRCILQLAYHVMDHPDQTRPHSWAWKCMANKIDIQKDCW